ncbi:hypothetical protein HN51_068639 [Arachis hypogaea]
MESLLFMFVSSNHLLGDLSDHASFVKAIKQVDVVICTNWVDMDRHDAVQSAASFYKKKVKIGRATETAGIPYTYVSSNCFAGYFLTTLSQHAKCHGSS